MAKDDRRGPRIGVLVPYTNVNLEPDMEMMRPEGSTLHFVRMGGYDSKAVPDVDQMAGLGASNIDEALRLISGVRPDIVLYGCTSATLTHGNEFDLELAKKIKKACRAKTVTAAGAMTHALMVLGHWHVGFASPYVKEINKLAVEYFKQNFIEVLRRVDIKKKLDNYGQGRMTSDEILDLALNATGPEVEAIVLSCTDMRAAELVDQIERMTDKTVITSNQALMFSVCYTLGLPRPARCQGTLFDALDEAME